MPFTSRVPDFTDVLAPRPRSEHPADGVSGGTPSAAPLSEYERERRAEFKRDAEREAGDDDGQE